MPDTKISLETLGAALDGTEDFVAAKAGANFRYRAGQFATYVLAGPTTRLGAADAAAPVAQTLSMQGVLAGTANTPGALTIIRGSAGTGTGTGGALTLQTAPAGGAGSAQNAFVTALTINGPGNVGIGSASATVPLHMTNALPQFRMDKDTSIGNTYTGVGVAPAFTSVTMFNVSRWSVGGIALSGFAGGATEPGLFVGGYQQAAATAPAVLFSAFRPNGADRQAVSGTTPAYMFQTGVDATFATAIMTMLGNGNTGFGPVVPTEKVDVTGNIRSSGYQKTTPVAVASLTAAATAGAGSRHFVTDSSVASAGNFGAIVAGGGANIVPVHSDGTNWRIG